VSAWLLLDEFVAEITMVALKVWVLSAMPRAWDLVLRAFLSL
jgi:hypothetical protein